MNIEDKFIDAMLDIQKDVKEMKQDLKSRPTKEELFTLLDQQGQILQRLDQERLFTLERIKRIEADVEQMKVTLNIA